MKRPAVNSGVVRCGGWGAFASQRSATRSMLPWPSSVPLRVGGRIGTYDVVDNLAEGGMGAVFRVKDGGERELALKAPLPEGRGGTFAHRMKRFLREVRLTSRMDHPGVAKVVEVGQEDGLPYSTMELVRGVSLADRI